ncbi:MAG TPA: hypothetical protein VFA43_10790 [Gemmatimonadaceae bacterium]|nr:hypothetical protein [Gemmatimonadaceae bacterium]
MMRHVRWSIPLLVAASGCKPSDVLSVPPPAGVIGTGTLENASGAESALNGARARLFGAVAGWNKLLQWTGVLTDEDTWTAYTTQPVFGHFDARVTTSGAGSDESGDAAIEGLAAARVSLVTAAALLEHAEPASGRPKIGEAYALMGFAELFMAEDYCAGVPLSEVVPGGGISYGMPLSTDSLLGVAEHHFDTALVFAGPSDVAGQLAAIGLGRTRLDRGNYAGAVNAVGRVPVAFVYNTELDGSFDDNTGAGINLYAFQGPNALRCGWMNVGDREGGNGENFASAGDARLVIDSTFESTCDGAPWRYPVKFGMPTQTTIPMATGVEARLIEAEGALHAGQIATWAASLNALRDSAPGTYLGIAAPMDSLTSDSTSGASASMRIDVMFRERAFWLFGTGTRLGDLRRLVRQYHRDQSAVFPSGAYAGGGGFTQYGTDVSLPLPTGAGTVPNTNPNYKGCLNHAA